MYVLIFITTGCRNVIHTMPQLAAMRLSTQVCPLEHPQVGKRTTASRPQLSIQRPNFPTGPLWHRRSGGHTSIPISLCSSYPTNPALLTIAGGLSSLTTRHMRAQGRNHRPTVASNKVFIPAPARPVVCLPKCGLHVS
jgi:hypothetical protein